MKLNKLILSGFKSFADRTEFAFDDGISCIVGPNGCGKSNIVDAFKWVLGAQSAKSLRGSEMMDVIFNGCATRSPAAGAEVTLVFDNAAGVLQVQGAAFDSGGAEGGQVSVTRRLFRDGQSDYLINKVPVRLRDVREMFMDTGVGVDAYSLIEQGRVEVFLQASQEERRAIFDEAAGISKYKARKKEALRKLDRVEQNLLRVTDIFGEVEKRLRSIKHQAGKARSYQTYSERLKELRSLFFLAQYHAFQKQRSEVERKLDAATDALAAVTTLLGQLEASRSATEVEAVAQEQAAREVQGQIATLGGQITSREQRADMLAARVGELGDQIVAAAGRAEELEAKIEEIRALLAAREKELADVEQQAQGLAQQCDAARDEHQAGRQAITHLQDQLEDEKAGTIDLLRRTAQLHNEIHSHKVRQDTLHGTSQRLRGRCDQIEESLRTMLAERAELQVRRDDIQSVLDDTEEKLDQTRRRRDELGDSERRSQEELSAARERRSGLLARTETLREMQKRREGVTAGVRRVLEARAQGRLQAVRGMLGDFVRTDTRHAPLVEAALAGADQDLIVERLADLTAEPLTEALGDAGSVSVLCLDRLGPLREDFDPAPCPQILGRMIDRVRFDPWLAPLMWRLLGRTFLVRALPDARAAAEAAPDGARFVTEAGEVLEADGRVRIGAANRAAGVIARRSELAELQETLAQVERTIADRRQQCRSVHEEILHADGLQQKLRTAIYEANTERVEADGRLERAAEQIETLQREQPVVAEELRVLAAEIDQAVRAEHEGRERAAELERINAERQDQIDRLTEQISAARGRQEELSARVTELKVSLAQAEEKKVSGREAIAATGRQREQMQRDLESARAEVDLSRGRREDAQAGIRTAREEIDRLYAEQQQRDREARDVEESRKGLQQKLSEIRAQLAARRKAQEEATAEQNRRRVEQNEIDVRIEGLISRGSDEMGMDLHELYASYEHDEQRDWDALETEINELRAKIERLGNVNLDAIAEQEELEQRREFLQGQLKDVEASRKQLDELIRRINRESREKFIQTFEAVRAGFQELFRKLFGGGKADVFLLDPEDVLESGIEVVARPPGKELRSISLLSGGEKTMTALALLFSIFRSRPSPLCLLDEVDAALDEANNERFNALVGEFVADSQFLVITHAKRTMSMGNVLYGVTMQEPGVSKRISVRFEDAGEKLDQQLEPAGA